MSKFWSNGDNDSKSSVSDESSAAADDDDDNDDASWGTTSDTGDSKSENNLEVGVVDVSVELRAVNIGDESRMKPEAKVSENFSAKSALVTLIQQTNKGNDKDIIDPQLDPNLVWERIKKDQIFAPLPKTKHAKKEPNCTRIVCMSDTHSKHRGIPFLPKGDILVHGGDFTKSGEIGTVQDLSDYFGGHASNFCHILCIAGNHELTFQPEFYANAKRKHKPKPFDPFETRAALRNCMYLEDERIVIPTMNKNTSVEVYGSPWTPAFYDWAFNLPRGPALYDVWSKIPTSTDVLVTHGPPLGRGDFTDHSGRSGCHDLLQEVQARVKPRLHIFGHIHQSYGVSFDGQTLYVNASNLDSGTTEVAPHRPCVVVDLPHDPSLPAQLVEPDCRITTVGEFQAWLVADGNDKQCDHLVAASLSGCPEDELPIAKAFADESAFFDLCSTLNLHRDKVARTEFQRALCQIYAESFSY